MQKFLMALTTAALVSCANSAEAAFIIGSQAFGVQAITPPTGNLATIPEFTNLTFVTESTGSTGSFMSVADNTSVGSAALTLTPAGLASFSFGNPIYGTFTASSGNELVNSGGFRNLLLLGTFAPGTLFGGLEPTAAEFRIAFTQSGDTISATATLFSNQSSPSQTDTVTPEPATIAMFGTMCIPLALGAFRRRQKAAQAAV